MNSLRGSLKSVTRAVDVDYLSTCADLVSYSLNTYYI